MSQTIMSETSEIVEFFTNKTVLLTGATGFVGQVTLERLLRVCNVGLVYTLVRQKKGKCEEERFNELVDDVVFDRMKEERPDYTKHLQMVTGDCRCANLGISDEDWKMLRDQVDVVIHCAATVRFDQDLRTAFNINIRATKDLILQAREMKKLKSFVYVGTAFSNCTNRKLIEERIYAPPMTAEQLELFLATFPDDAFVKTLEKSILQDIPNTYTYSKCVVEELVDRMAKDKLHPLPLSIVRPSMILSTYKEPIAGWNNNLYGPPGVTTAVCVGLLHTVRAKSENKADMVPVDRVISAIIAVAWNTAKKRPCSQPSIDIYNYTSWNNSIDWQQYSDYNYKYADENRPMATMWVPFLIMNRYVFVHNLYWFFLHTIPAYIFDTVARIWGKPPQLVEGFKKIDKFCNVISYFACREWQMPHRNILKLFNRMNKKDKELFDVRMSTVDWLEYFRTYMQGGRIYFLKDPISTLPTAQRRYRYILLASHVLKGLGVAVLCLLLNWILSIFKLNIF